MQEITRVFLENEMDVILAHKRSMRLAELAGLTLSGQTAFATAVSEVARNAVEQSNSGQLILGIDSRLKDADKYILAVIRETAPQENDRRAEGYQYARKLVNNISIDQNELESNIELRFRIPGAQRLSQVHFSKWVDVFENDLPSSPYDEIKRKNRQLVDLADKLRASELQYRILTETLPLLIFTWEEDRGLTYINHWTETFTGYTLKELAETRWKPVYHPDDYQGTLEYWAENRTNNEPVSGQMRLRHAATGEYLWHMSQMIPQKDEEGNVRYWIGYCVDIHAQKMIEQTLKDNKELIDIKSELEANEAELQLKVRQLNQSNIELERFAYVASHDLQEPLRKIVFYSDYLSKKYAGLYDAQGAMFFGNMIASTRHMQQLIRDVLAYSTIGREPSTGGVVDLNDTIREALQSLDLIITDKCAAMEIGVLPKVKGNAFQLRQLFENLLGNALKYSRSDVTPMVTVGSIIDPAGMVHISITDNGIGFEDQYLDKIFNLFQRLHSRQEYEGTGIGLAICKRVAELHGGAIKATGKPGEGAVFQVVLPGVEVED